MTAWPRLDYAADAGTVETLHLLLQLVGKLPTRLHPWINHGWHVALRMTPRGAITRPMPAGDRCFTVALDFARAEIAIDCEGGGSQSVPAAGKTVAEVHHALGEALETLGLPAPLHGMPNELPDPVPFAQDHRPREFDAGAAQRLHAAFLAADRAFNRFRARYRGKTSPSHLFWGSFDLAVTRFSGRTAPPHPGGIPHLPDEVTREAYSHEVISAGFWPGNGGLSEAAFYAYAYPVPNGLDAAPVAPAAASWNGDLGEFLLPYEAVRTASDPDEAVARFLSSSFDAAAALMQWPRDTLIEGPPARGRPPAA